MDQLLLRHIYSMNYFLNVRIASFAIGEYLAEEVYSALDGLYVAFLLSLDDYSHADHLGGCDDV